VFNAIFEASDIDKYSVEPRQQPLSVPLLYACVIDDRRPLQILGGHPKPATDGHLKTGH
jgi:hypothetical protein